MRPQALTACFTAVLGHGRAQGKRPNMLQVL
jgi:hypothetical protein